MPPHPLPHGQEAPGRTLLSLSLVPARERRVVCPECHDRSGLRGSLGRGARDHRYAFEQREGTENRALPELQSGSVEQLFRCGPGHSIRSGRHAGCTGSCASRHPHLYFLQAAMDPTSGGRSIRRGILRSGIIVAAGESRPSSLDRAADRKISGITWRGRAPLTEGEIEQAVVIVNATGLRGRCRCPVSKLSGLPRSVERPREWPWPTWGCAARP